jgi:hypothetical protein
MVMKNKKVLIIIVLISVAALIAGFIFFIVNVFTGNPVSKSIAKNKAQQYIHDVYTSDNKIDKIYYSAKDGYYIAHAKIGNVESIFKYSSNQITDENVTDYFQNLFNQDYNTICKSFNNANLEFPTWIYVHTSVVANGNYSTDFKKLTVDQKIYLMGIRNSDKSISENDSKHMAAKITKEFLDKLDDKYNFRSTQMTYLDKFGLYEINIKNKDLTIDELLKNTKKIDSKEIGEEEKAFIENFN